MIINRQHTLTISFTNKKIINYIKTNLDINHES